MGLSKEHARLFVRSFREYEQYQQQQQQQQQEEEDEEEDEKEKEFKFSPKVQKELDSLCGSLQEVIEKMRGDGGSTFVKASSRSAKDTPISSKEYLKKIFISCFKNNQKVDQWPEEDGKMKALLQAATEMLRISEAKTAIDCFARSERIAFDMGLALEVEEKVGKWEENFVVRKWHNIAVDMEFRGFVFGGKMVALSQYNHMFVSPRVVENKDYLLKIILDCFNEVKQRLEGVFDNYIIDFAVTGEKWADLVAPNIGGEGGKGGEERVWVIELNPYHFSTDATLFSWKEEGELLKKGREDGEVEFRVRETFDSVVLKGIKQDWRELVKMDLSSC